MFEADALSLLARELLRERTGELVAEACAWAVGLSDRPWYVRRAGRVVAGGTTLGARAAAGLPLTGEEDVRLELGESRPGSFGDALGALTPDGRLYAELLDDQLLQPFVLQTCVRAAERARGTQPQAWRELVDEVGEDDPHEVVRAAEWEAPLRTDAEQLVLAALADVPLVAVEAEGLPLSLVRAAEGLTREAAPAVAAPAPGEEDVAGALFLADVALRQSGLPAPVPVGQAESLLAALVAEGLEPQEVLHVLPHLPVHADTAERIADALAQDDL